MAKGKENPESENSELHDFERRKRNRRQIIGIFLGIGLGLIIGSVVPSIRENYSLSSLVLWSGAIGGAAASLEYFEKAGAALTRTENRFINYLIGVGIPVLVIVALALWV